MPTQEELDAVRARIGLAPARDDQQQQAGFTRQPASLGPQPQQQKPTRGGFSGFVKRISTPLVDVPTLPGGPVGRIVENGIESVTSPIGLLSTALIPVTGGSSLGLAGAAGTAARLGTRFAAEAAAGGIAGKASEVAAEKLKNAPGAVRLAGSLGAAVLAGGAAGAAASRLLKVGSQAAVKGTQSTTRVAVDSSPPTHRRVVDSIPVPEQLPIGIRARPDVVASKKWFHGTGAKDLEAPHLSPGNTSENGLFGQGIYLTDNPKIAEGYARNRSKFSNGRPRPGTEPSIYQMEVAPQRVLDLNEVAGQDLRSVMQGMVDNTLEPNGYGEALTKALKNPEATGYDLYQGMRNDLSEWSHGENIPSGEFIDIVGEGVTGPLQQLGYDAYTHTGGLNSGSPHQVLVLFDPNDAYAAAGRTVPISGWARFSPDDMLASANVGALATPEGTVAQSLGGLTPEADQVIAALNEAAKKLKDPAVRKQLKFERGNVLAGRISSGYEAAGKTGGSADEIIRARAGALRGQLPKLDFPELNIQPDTVEALRQSVLHSDRLTSLDQISAHDGLMKALVGQTVPTSYEIKLLERVFGPAFSSALVNVKPYSLGRFVSDAINLPRALVASSDLSFPLNQGLLAAGASPKEWAKSVKVAAKAFVDPAYAKQMDDWVRGVTGSVEDRAISALAQKAGLPFTGSAATSEELFHQSDKLMATLFKSNAAGSLLTASERGYVAPGNYLRYQLFNKTIKKMAEPYVRPGEDFAKALDRIPFADAKRLADTVSVLTGRSSVKALSGDSKYGPALNAFFFAPNFLASRLQAPLLPLMSFKKAVQEGGMGVLARPDLLYKSDPVLALQARALGGFLAQGGAALAAMKIAKESGALPDFNVEFDPRSSNFGKGKVGNQAFDFWGGYSQIARAVARTITGEQKTSAGNIVSVPRDNVIWDQFVRSKVAPAPGLAWDVLTGTTYMGERVTASPDAIDSALAQRLLPLAMQDVIRGYVEGGAGAGVAAVPSVLGGRITTFSSLASVKDDVAQEKFSKPFRELDQRQRTEVENNSKVLDKQREWDLVTGDTFGKAIDNINFERSQTEYAIAARYLSKVDGIDQFVNHIEDAQLAAATSRQRAAEQFGVKPTAKTSMLDQGMQQWQQLYDLADIGYEKGIKTHQIDWDKFSSLEASLFKQLTPEQVKFIEERTASPHDKSVEWYFNNKKYINDSGYYDIADTVFAKSRAAKQFGSYGEFLAAVDFATRTGDVREQARLKGINNQLENQIGSLKQRARKADPRLDASLIAIGRADKPLTPAARKLLNQ